MFMYKYIHSARFDSICPHNAYRPKHNYADTYVNYSIHNYYELIKYIIIILACKLN